MMDPHKLAAHAYLGASFLALFAVAHMAASRNWDGYFVTGLVAVILGWLAGIEKQAERDAARRCVCGEKDLRGATFHADVHRLHSRRECGATTAETIARVSS